MSDTSFYSFYYIKSMHIAGVVCWFAGLFYIVRLFIYHVEANEKPETEKLVLQKQFEVMQRRLWLGITVPAMWVTLLMGGHLVAVLEAWSMPWFHIKALCVVLLVAYHVQCGRIRKQLLLGSCTWSSKKLRVFNEVATVLLFAIVFAVVTKSPMMVGYGMLGFLVFAILLMVFLRKRLQGKTSKTVD